MTLRCRPGDLAVIVRSYAGNDGVTVTCLRLIPNWTRQSPFGGLHTGPGWVTDRWLRKHNGMYGNIVADDCLRPIRDSDGPDEMLRIAGKPTEEVTQ